MARIRPPGRAPPSLDVARPPGLDCDSLAEPLYSRLSREATANASLRSRHGSAGSKGGICALWRSVDDRSNRAGIGSSGFRAPMRLTGDREMMDVAAIRAEIPALDKTIYLNTGG